MTGPGGPPADAEGVHLHAEVTGNARSYQAGRDLHVHYRSGTQDARWVEPGAGTEVCPYPGLAAFGSDQAGWFFGRRGPTAELTGELARQPDRGGPVMVVAPSGAGKSSLLRAGLLPALARGALPAVGSSTWPRLVFSPTAHPRTELAGQLAVLTGAEPAAVAAAMVDRDTFVCMVREALRSGDAGAESARVVLVVDQLEELFTVCTDEGERHEFVERLCWLAAPDPSGTAPVGLVVCGLRSDFYTPCTGHPELRAALRDRQVLVGPMSPDELREAIVFPAEAVGLEFEPGLVELLLRDLGMDDRAMAAGGAGVGAGEYEAGRLPLLAHALRATWQQRAGHLMTVDGYRATGGIRHAVATTAERVFAGLDPASQAVTKALFLRLVMISHTAEDTRRRIDREDLVRDSSDPAVAASVLEDFTRARLLSPKRETVEITHEVLLRAWPRLRGWIDSDRAGNVVRQDLEDTAGGWDRDRRDASALYRGSRLEAARAWVDAHPEGGLSATAAAFLAASTRQQRRTATLRRTAVAVLAVLALLASTAAAVAFQQRASARHATAAASASRQDALRQRDQAIANRVETEANQVRALDSTLAAELDVAAYRIRPDPGVATHLTMDADSPLSTFLAGVVAAAFGPGGRTLLVVDTDERVYRRDVADLAAPNIFRPLVGPPPPGDGNRVTIRAFSPDGSRYARASRDGVVRVWGIADPGTDPPAGVLPPHGAQELAFSSDGRVLAVAGDDHVVRLWDVSDPARPRLAGERAVVTGGRVDGLAFGPGGRVLAVAGDDHLVRLWNVSDPARPSTLGEQAAGPVAFSPDGRTLAVVGDRGVQLWDVSNPARPAPHGRPFAGRAGSVGPLAFSPDGRTLASAGTDHTVQLWDLTGAGDATGAGEPLTGHIDDVASVAFSPDGRTLASVGRDQSVRLWALPPSLPTEGAPSVAFSPDGRILANAGFDGAVRLWRVADPAHPTMLAQRRVTGGEPVQALAFSPDGKLLATGGGDGRLWLWTVSDPAHPSAPGPVFTGEGVYTVAFSPNGRVLASGGGDGQVRLWDLADPARPVPLRTLPADRTGIVSAVAFSPDGRALASAGYDGTVRLWDVADPGHAAPRGPALVSSTGRMYSVAFSPRGRLLASGGEDGEVRLWKVADAARPVPLRMPPVDRVSTVSAVAFGPDGRSLASASYDGTVRLWDVADPAHVAPYGQPLTGPTGQVDAVAFSPDGRTLASGGSDAGVQLWVLDPTRAIRRICAAGEVTRARWQQYIPDVAYRPPCP